MIGVIKRLFNPRPSIAGGVEAVERQGPSESLHWGATGLFRLSAVGESYYREALVRIAKNEPGKGAMAFCTARLVPEDLNPHDKNAVAVYVGEFKVGHLARDTAVEFRAALSRLEHRSLPQTTCDAVILNGLVADGRMYEYSIELDLEPNGEPPTPAIPKYFKVERRDFEPPLKSQGVGLYEVAAWMPQEALDNMDKRQRVESWTTDHWDTINYYLRNRQGIGLGFKVLAVPKELHRKLFGAGEPEVAVMRVEGRTVTLLFKRVSAGI